MYIFKQIHSAILAFCQATNLTAQLSCDTNTLTLMWAQSQLQGTNYILQTEMINSNLPPSSYTTTNASYTLTNLLCGRRYAFRIAVQDGQSRSSYSPATQINTGKKKIYSQLSLQQKYNIALPSSSVSSLSAFRPHGSRWLWNKQRQILLGWNKWCRFLHCWGDRRAQPRRNLFLQRYFLLCQALLWPVILCFTGGFNRILQ